MEKSGKDSSVTVTRVSLKGLKVSLMSGTGTTDHVELLSTLMDGGRLFSHYIFVNVCCQVC